MSGPPTPVPPVKPFVRQVLSDLDGRLWVRIYTKGEQYDPPPPKAQGSEPPPPAPVRWREPW